MHTSQFFIILYRKELRVIGYRWDDIDKKMFNHMPKSKEQEPQKNWLTSETTSTNTTRCWPDQAEAAT